MKYKVHWIIDGIVDVDASSQEDVEKKIQEELEEYVKSSFLGCIHSTSSRKRSYWKR